MVPSLPIYEKWPLVMVTVTVKVMVMVMVMVMVVTYNISKQNWDEIFVNEEEW